MINAIIIRVSSILAVFMLISTSWSDTPAASPERHLDLVHSGRLMSWSKPDAAEVREAVSLSDLAADARCIGVVWNEERDVCEIHVRLAGLNKAADAEVQYWFQTWPSSPPAMPTIEDPCDDPWQGDWITAQVQREFRDGVSIFTFKPLDKAENPLADNLPGVNYRRTLKIRLLLPPDVPKLESLEMFSDSLLKPLSVRIEFGCGEPLPACWSGSLEIFNGELVSARPWNFEGDDRFLPPCAWQDVRTSRPKGIIAEILAAEPAPPGSNDATVVTVRATADLPDGKLPRTFSFNTLDLQRGPIYVPDLHVMATRADDPNRFSADYPARGRKIREQIPQEPEQTYQRAGKEIPPLDPWVRQGGDKVYLPLAADASWQKFAVEYGGEIFISKGGTKAKGTELDRLQWQGDTIRFRLGTQRAGSNAEPYYREDHKATVSIAEDCLPIVTNRWEHEGLAYEQETLATLLTGPLDPNDPERSEQTPAVLMMKLSVRNPGTETARAACTLNVEPREKLIMEGNRLYDQSDARRLLMVLVPPEQAQVELSEGGGLVCQFDVPAGGTQVLQTRIPFVSDLGDGDAAKLESLDYAAQRQRVAQYWRDMISKTVGFTTPEPEFNHLARSVVPHIHISTTKDPKSGLYMVPAASYAYDVFANEACFQTLMLDALGDTVRAGQYLKTLTALQGSQKPIGNYIEPHDGFFHGARVDSEYDYTMQYYVLDQGTVLWTLAHHYFFTRDAQWFRDNLPHVRKAVEWIERQRALTKKCNARGEKPPEYGLLSAGHLEDNPDWGYWFAVNAYCVAGMRDMAAALKDIRHDDAESLERQAAAYLDDFRTAVLRAAEMAPVVRMRDGTYSPYVPTRVYQRFRNFGPLRVQYYSRYGLPDVLPCYRLSATREVLYGPMILLNLRLFEPDEPIANWILDDWEDNLTLSSSGGFNVHGFTDDKYWFSQGGMVFQANLQNPILPYLYRNETPAAIRGIYNGLVSCLYPEVHALTEEYRQWRHASGPFYKCPDEARLVTRIRDMLVLESGDDLLLAAGVPRRWLASQDGIKVDRINSYFGPVAYSIQTNEKSNTLTARVTTPTRSKPEHIWLYVRLPHSRKITAVEIDDKPWTKFDAEQERIELPQTDKPLEVTIHSR